MIVRAIAEPRPPSPQAQSFYEEALRELTDFGLPFLIAGTYAVSAYTGIQRATKDLDVFCRPGDYPRILAHFKDRGFVVEIEDDRWIGKVFQGEYFFDLIFAAANGTMPVSDEWFAAANELELFGMPMRVVGPTELVCSKVFIQSRTRYDGADVALLILRQSEHIDWRRMLGYLELHWEVLLAQLINFRWMFPTERDRVPRWLMDELVDRLRDQLELPEARIKVCRGRMFSRADYEIAIREWGFADVGGDEGRHG
jgi:hypothetical protein